MLIATSHPGSKLLRGLAAVAVFALAGSSGAAQTFTTLYVFNGKGTDGAVPTGLIEGKNSALYGTTLGVGGDFGLGTVFELRPPKGALYGTTSTGGSSGQGTVLQLTPAADGVWTGTVLYSFTGLNGDGAAPYAGVIFGAVRHNFD